MLISELNVCMHDEFIYAYTFSEICKCALLMGLPGITYLTRITTCDPHSSSDANEMCLSGLAQN